MKLFYKPGACSLVSHVTLRESGKDFTPDGIDLTRKRLKNGNGLLAVNPKRQAPTPLLDDGTLLIEGVAIMQYLADSVPDRQPLVSASSPSRYKTIEWFNYTATELYKDFMPLFHPDMSEDFKPTVRVLLEKKMQYVNDSLKDDQWICSLCFSIASAYLFIVLRWTYAAKLNMAGLGNIDAYMA